MAFIKVLVSFAMLVSIASPFAIFDQYGLTAYNVFNGLQRAWVFCPTNSTNRTEYEVALKETSNCLDLIQKNQSVCHNLKDRVLKCSQPVVEFFLDCLPERSKDLPPAFAKAIMSLIGEFCSSSGEVLLESWNPCIYDYNSEQNITIKDECKGNIIQAKLNRLQAEPPSKSEACQAYREVGGCWRDFVNENCNSAKTRDFFSKFYNAAYAPCKE